MKIGDKIWETHDDDRVEFRAGREGHHVLIFGYTGLTPAEIDLVVKSPFTIGFIENRRVFICFMSVRSAGASLRIRFTCNLTRHFRSATLVPWI